MLSRFFLLLLSLVVVVNAQDENSTMTIYDTLSDGNSTFGFLIEEAGLENFYNLQNGITVFVPTEEAFERVDSRLLAYLLSPSGKIDLAELLLYHTLHEEVYSRLIPKHLIKVKTTEGRPLSIMSNAFGDVKVNDALVEEADIVAENGVIHYIDEVLLLPFGSSKGKGYYSKGKGYYKSKGVGKKYKVAKRKNGSLFGKGFGKGKGKGTIFGNGKGYGKGKGSLVGKGKGVQYWYSNGNGYTNGQANGNGYANGQGNGIVNTNGQGNTNPSGYTDWTGQGYGKGTGKGYGKGKIYSTGKGYEESWIGKGTSKGKGYAPSYSGYGNGYGNGNGNGNVYSNGKGNSYRGRGGNGYSQGGYYSGKGYSKGNGYGKGYGKGKGLFR